MRWRKVGRIYDGPAAYPTVDRVGGEVRVYFARRDDAGRSRIRYLTAPAADPLAVGPPSERPVLDLGAPGTFDADGHAPRCVVEAGGVRRLYLIGWNRSQTVPYHLSIGCALSADGRAWEKLPGPVMDRSVDEPFFCTSPCVLWDGGTFRMWYCGGLGWERQGDRPEPLYRIHHAESADGLRWRKTPHVCIDGFPGGDAIGWPTVWREGGRYRMLFSYRGRADYRDNPAFAYRLGSADSADGLRWELRTEGTGLDRSPDGWDSVMVAYPALYGDHLFYNGNGFGATGIGAALRVREGEAGHG